MRRVGVLVVIAVGVIGCFDPQVHPGQACANGRCPGDLECVAGVCELPGTGGPDATFPADDAPPVDGSMLIDTDGDGEPDSDDNCIAVPNPDQHDEDLDAVGDPCDRCPYVGVATADSDGDGIGDMCDPRPSNPDDVLDRFYTFASMPTDVIRVPPGDWTIANDAIVYDSGTTGWLTVQGTRSHVMIVMGGDVLEVAASCELKLIAGATANNVYTGCTFDDDPGAPTIEIEDESGTGTTIIGSDVRPDALDLGPYLLSMIADPVDDDVVCSGTEGGDFVDVDSLGTATALTAGQVRILSRNTRVSVRFLAIVVMN